MATYYVKQTSTGTADGLSEANAWSAATLASNWATVAGNTVYLLGTITGTLTPNASGTSDSARTILRGDYTGFEANMVASGFHCIDINGYSNFEVKNIPNMLPVSGRAVYMRGACSNVLVDNITAGTTSSAPAIDYDGYGDNIEIKNCTLTAVANSIELDGNGSGNITNISIHDNTLTNSGNHGIFVSMADADAYTVTGLDIYNNTVNTTGVVSANGNGIRVWRESINTGARLSTIKIYDNTVSNTVGIGIGVALCDEVEIYGNTCNEISTNSNGQGIGVYGTTNFTVNNNTISNVYTNAAPSDGHGIDFDYQLDTVSGTYYYDVTGTCYANRITNSADSANTPGINFLSTDGIHCYGNILINCVNGIKFGTRGGAGTPAKPQNNIISNNTFIAGTNSVNGIRITDIATANQATFNTNKFNNNIIQGFTNAVIVDASDGDLVNVDYNVYYDNTNDEVHSGTGAITSTGEITTDPQLDANNVPASTSPCVGTGTKWWGNTLNPQGQDGEPFADYETDIGAIQSKHSKFHPTNL